MPISPDLNASPPISEEGNNIFLAATALEEFWKPSRRMLFLSEACRLYSRKDYWIRLDAEVLPPAVADVSDVEKAIVYCSVAYEACLKELTARLNTIHNTDKPVRYWNVILGNWLLSFIHQTYYEYLSLRNALKKYPGADTLLLEESQYYVPLNYGDFGRLFLCSDEYRLQKYSQILRELYYCFPAARLSSPLKQPSEYGVNTGFKSRILQNAGSMLSSLQGFLSEPRVLVTQPYFENKVGDRLKLLLASGGRVFFDDMKYEVRFPYQLNWALRRGLEPWLKGDEFLPVLSRLIMLNLPVVLLEGYAEHRRRVMELPIKKSGAYYTANALVGDNDIFRFHVAENIPRALLMNHQHGGGYGTDKIHPSEELEKNAADGFYTWGWRENEKTRPLAHPKLNKDAGPLGKQVFLTMTIMGRYLTSFCFNIMPQYFIDEYMAKTAIFINSLRPEVDLLVRTYFQESSQSLRWYQKERLMDSCPGCKLDDFSVPFRDRLAACGVFVADHFSTTSLEALAAAKPTVIFLNRKIFRVRREAEKYFKMLEEAGILYYTPEEAAEHVNRIAASPETWWNSRKVAVAVKEFCGRYACRSGNWAGDWAEEFSRLQFKDENHIH